MKPVKQKDGMLRAKPRTKKFMMDLKIKTNANSLDELLWVILKCPQVPQYVFDFYRKSFDLTPQQIEAYKKQHKIAPIGLIKAEYKGKGRTLVLDKDLDVVRRS